MRVYLPRAFAAHDHDAVAPAIRDYAFATDAASVGTLRTELESIRIRDRSILADYGRLLQDPERQSYEALESVESSYSDGIVSALDTLSMSSAPLKQTGAGKMRI